MSRSTATTHRLNRLAGRRSGRRGLVLLLLLAAPARAAGAAAPLPLERQVDALFAESVPPDAPGCALAVIRDGKIVEAKGYGRASLELGVPITPATVFDIGSTSKQFTAACILMLERDGKLSLDDDIRRFLPEVPDYGTKITIRHLLHHTSGLRDYIDLMVLGGHRIADWTTVGDALATVARQRHLDFPPGSEHSYSNTGYFLLAQIAERASGKRLSELARERIFAPLGMKHTEILDDHARVVPGKATAYEPRPGGGYALATSDWEQTGDGAVQTTVSDLALWDQNFYSGRVGGSALVAALQERGRLDDGTTIDYARGLFVDRYRGLDRVAHGGAWAGFRAQLLRFPSEKLSVAVLCNLASLDPEDLAQQVADLVLEGRLGPAPAASPAQLAPATPIDGARYAGVFWSEGSALARRIEARGDQLFYVRTGGGESALAVAGADRFAMVGTPAPTSVIFESTAEGARRFRVEAPGRPAVSFVEVTAPAGEIAVSDFAGRYASDEVRTAFRVLASGGGLEIETARGERRRLDTVFRDAFLDPELGVVRFVRDGEGRVRALLVSVGRTRGLEFVRGEG